MVGDKWTMLVVRDLASRARRMTDILDGLYPISSRTLVARLRDMEKDGLLERMDYGGNPPRVEYALTERGLLLLPLVDALRETGQTLGCNECDDRKERLGTYCEACPLETRFEPSRAKHDSEGIPSAPRQRREQDDSIVLL